MSKNILYVTVGALALLLGLLSYTLRKQTDPPPQSSAQEVQAQQARQAEVRKQQLAAQINQLNPLMKKHMRMIKHMSPGARTQMSAMLDAAKKLKNKQPARTTDLSDDWFTKGQDGAQN